MATSDERRKVAERLRDLPRTADADGCCTAWDVLFALGMKQCDAIGFVPADNGMRLAHLIDPTCEDVGDEAHFVCSSCGCRVDRWQGDLDLDPITPTVMEDGEGLVTPRFCPSCGSRVVRR